MHTPSKAPLVHTFYCKSHDIIYSTHLNHRELLVNLTINTLEKREEVWGVTMVVHALTWTLDAIIMVQTTTECMIT